MNVLHVAKQKPDILKHLVNVMLYTNKREFIIVRLKKRNSIEYTNITGLSYIPDLILKNSFSTKAL